MKTIELTLETDFAGATHRDEIEVEDYIANDDHALNEFAVEWAWDKLNLHYKIKGE